MPTEQRSPVSRRKLGIFGIVAVIVALLVVVTGIRAREDSSAKLREWTDNQAIPTVAVVLPDAKVLNATIDLPGRLEAYYRAPIFARVSGYLKSWNADIGAKVKAGQVIAEIEAPDLDQQLLQARADLTSQEASAKLSEATLNRRRKSMSVPPISPTRRPPSIPVRPMSNGWKRWPATRKSPCRSMAWSLRAKPTSAP
jgi:multidrug efflux pump subunit AcrA (membrane-fusion protein)